MKHFKEFIDRRLYRIRGFMHPSDAIAFSAIMACQREQSWQGAYAEIGVFYGRSLSLMALDAHASGSKVIGIDLFDIPGQQDYVEEQLGTLGLSGSTILHTGSSLEPEAALALQRIGPVRLFSIDGGHELAHIENDAEMALQALSAEGVIAFDDFMNSQYPDLSRGIIRFLEANSDRLVPFAITKTKLYCCPPEVYEAYFAAMNQVQLWGGMWSEAFRFLDQDVMFLTQPMLGRAVYQTLAERGLGSLGSLLGLDVRRRFARQ